MDPNVTRPLRLKSVLYRCACGEELMLELAVGGQCGRCHREISSKLLNHEFSLSVTIDAEHFELEQPATDSVQSADEATTGLPDTAISTDDDMVANDPNQLIDQLFGHFKIVAPLGQGGMGQVYRALDTSLQRYVAVKVLRSGIGTSQHLEKSSDDEVEKLLQEAISQARVSHPNIVTIYFVGKQEEAPFLAMELVNGQPLSSRIKAGDFSFHELISISLQIAEALRFSYELDILHGDIKPSNVLLQQSGIAKLSDFGMARRVSLNQEKVTGGTPNYIAPELLKGQRPTVESDIYALGVTLYEMSFRKLPVELNGITVDQWLQTHQSSTLTFPSPWPDRLPETWRKVLQKMLAKETDQRYSSYDRLIADLKNLKPPSQVPARQAPRLIAALIDWVIVLLAGALLTFVLQATSLEQTMSRQPLVRLLLGMINFLPIALFTLGVYWWRQSIGRTLMHVRVINRFGLPASSNLMTLRSLLRMQLPWVAIWFVQFDSYGTNWLNSFVSMLLGISATVTIVSLVATFFFKKRQSLHDLIFGTQVVLDIRE